MSARKFSVVLPDGKSVGVELKQSSKEVEVLLEGRGFKLPSSTVKGKVLRRGKQIFVSTPEMQGVLEIVEQGRNAATGGGVEQTAMTATFPGRVVKLLVEPKRWVEPGEKLVVLEAMKMEFAFRAPEKIYIEEVLVKEGEVLEKGRPFFKYTNNHQ